MKSKLVKEAEVVHRKINDNYNIKNIITKDISKDVSLAISEGKDYSETTRNKKSNRIYYVLEGKLIIKEDDETLIINPGDAIFIPADTLYHFEGTFKAILINSPSFNPNDEEIKEKLK